MYLLQVITKDFELQLKTEVLAESIKELKVKANEMVKMNASVIGMKYIIAEYKKTANGFDCETLKVDVITGC